jgi:hypothetical protein
MPPPWVEPISSPKPKRSFSTRCALPPTQTCRAALPRSFWPPAAPPPLRRQSWRWPAGAAGAWHPPLCPALGEHEALLVAATALAQRGARQAALALLCRILPPIDAYRATSQAIAIGTAFRLAGLSLACPWRTGAVPGFRA